MKSYCWVLAALLLSLSAFAEDSDNKDVPEVKEAVTTPNLNDRFSKLFNLQITTESLAMNAVGGSLEWTPTPSFGIQVRGVRLLNSDFAYSNGVRGYRVGLLGSYFFFPKEHRKLSTRFVARAGAYYGKWSGQWNGNDPDIVTGIFNQFFNIQSDTYTTQTSSLVPEISAGWQITFLQGFNFEADLGFMGYRETISEFSYQNGTLVGTNSKFTTTFSVETSFGYAF